VIFIVLNGITEVFVVPTSAVCVALFRKLLAKVRDYRLDDATFRMVLSIFANNLVTYKDKAHELAIEGLLFLRELRQTSMISMLYMNRHKPEDDICFDAEFEGWLLDEHAPPAPPELSDSTC